MVRGAFFAACEHLCKRRRRREAKNSCRVAKCSNLSFPLFPRTCSNRNAMFQPLPQFFPPLSPFVRRRADLHVAGWTPCRLRSRSDNRNPAPNETTIARVQPAQTSGGRASARPSLFLARAVSFHCTTRQAITRTGSQFPNLTNKQQARILMQ